MASDTLHDHSDNAQSTRSEDEDTGADAYRELFERSADAILIIDGETFIDCNRATVEMLRYADKQQLLQTHPSQLSPPTQPDGRGSFEKANEMIEIARRNGSHRFEWDHKRADQTVFPVEVLLTVVRKDSKPILHVVWRDITHRKHIEAELRQAQKMEAIGQLAGGIAHDFNNLLVAIMGHNHLLERKLPPGDPRIDHVTGIRQASERACTLVSQLLTFSRKQVLRPATLDLNRELRGLGSLLARLIGEDIEVRFELTNELLFVRADLGQLEQVLMNLATNARDAMPGGGTLSIATRRLELDEQAIGISQQTLSGAYCVLTITDSGCGIQPSVLPKVFEPFFTTKPVGHGTGLGLANVYGMVTQSGGHVEIVSELNSGTAFKIYLPQVERPAILMDKGPRHEASTAGHKASETILLVEDEEQVGALMARVLASAGYTVHRAGDGAQAIDMVENQGVRFDLLVTDVVMPRMGGTELVRRLTERVTNLKVLFSSGYSPGKLDESVDVLHKPFLPSTLLERVRAALAENPSPCWDK